jgi:hypothetical protein
MSADGGKLVAAAKDGGIYTLQTTANPSLSITASGGNAVICWTIPSMSFGLQENSNLTGTNWTQVGTIPSLNVTNFHNQVIVPITGNSAFYRLKSLLHHRWLENESNLQVFRCNSLRTNSARINGQPCSQLTATVACNRMNPVPGRSIG